VEEFGPLFHQGTERFEAGNLIERKLYRVSNSHNPSLSIMEFERNTLMLNFLLGGGEWIKETDRNDLKLTTSKQTILIPISLM
jgi:hypothetical protein